MLKYRNFWLNFATSQVLTGSEDILALRVAPEFLAPIQVSLIKLLPGMKRTQDCISVAIVALTLFSFVK